ncbi:uncharacterized protein Bfra_004237 [Botrytis fragariae]|uniref:Uncharacterized protein n=1 Tax=Botrytis fragariae TaxID=1964551 RepID=A0A8H6EJ81_9HELO|nr:uncharacterized protein Bfra_004237 [Botrytis fragariae]KAF5874231.1 hypothetical protein Bfra_004237 [Botrytis fragariae]
MVIPNLQMPFPVFQEGEQLLQVSNDVWQALGLVRTGLKAAKPGLIEVEDCASSYIHEVKCIGLGNLRSHTRIERIETMWVLGISAL